VKGEKDDERKINFEIKTALTPLSFGEGLGVR